MFYIFSKRQLFILKVYAIKKLFAEYFVLFFSFFFFKQLNFFLYKMLYFG